MAITKIHAIKSTLKKALDYIMDEKKTDEKLLVSSFGVAPETAYLEYQMTREISEEIRGKQKEKNNNLAHHIIQSFEPKEATPELAHELGQKLADEILGGKYEYVISTHIDKGHIHNHIIFNAISHEDYKKFDSNRKSYWNIRNKSDSLCKEYGLSVIKEPIKKGMSYKEWKEKKAGTSWKVFLQINIDKNIKLAKDFDSFVSLMSADGYEIKQGKHIAFRAKGQERFTRAKILGENYTTEQIEKRIKEAGANRLFMKVSDNVYRGQIENVSKKHIDLASTLLVKNYLAERRNKRRYIFTKSRNSTQIQKISQQLFFLRDNHITNGTELKQKINELNDTAAHMRTVLKSEEQALNQLQEQSRYIFTYQKYEAIYKQYQKSTFKKSFEQQHHAELKLFETAKDKLQGFGINDFDKCIVLLRDKQKYVNDLRDKYKNADQKLTILNSIRDDINRKTEINKSNKSKKSKNIDF